MNKLLLIYGLVLIVSGLIVWYFNTVLGISILVSAILLYQYKKGSLKRVMQNTYANKWLFLKTAVKLVLFSVGIITFIMLVGSAIGWLTDSVGLMIVGMMASFVFGIWLLAISYPTIFKSYKKYYDRGENNVTKESKTT